MHTINACLVFLLVTRLGMRSAGIRRCGALRPTWIARGRVSWTDARFDLLAAFFALCVIVLLLDYCRTGRRLFYLPAIVCAALAVYSKESAFCLPLLPLALLPLLPRAQWRRVMAASAAIGLVCAVLFAYRWWALGGLGGYADPSGVSTYWRSRPPHTLEAMLFREWAFVFFPVNWSVPLEWWLRAAAAGFIGVFVLWPVIGPPGGGAARAGELLAGLAFLVAASIPVQHLLMFYSDFAGARVLYLPLAGFAIFFATLIDRAANHWLAYALATMAIVFNIAALEHNLRPWRTTPDAAAAVCRALGNELGKDPRPVFVSGLPDRLDGVYFLFNGFPECVEMNSGQPAARVHVLDGTAVAPPGVPQFKWNQGQGRLREIP